MFCLIFNGLAISTSFGQVRVVEDVDKALRRHMKGAPFEINLWLLKDGQLKFSFRGNDTDDHSMTDILFKNEKDFASLMEIVMDGFDRNPEAPIKVDLGDSFLFLYYENMVLGKPLLRMAHSFKASPYARITSNSINRRDMEKFMQF